MQRSKTRPNESPRYNIKQSDNVVPVMPSLTGVLCPGVVTPDRVLFMGQIELFDIQTECKQITYAELNYFI